MKRVLLGLFLFLIPGAVNAASYTISNQLIEAQILKDGDLYVQELIVMDGTFNGYEKTLSYANSLLEDNYSSYDNNSLYNGSGIELVSMEAKKISGDVSFDTLDDNDFTKLQLVNYANNGDMTVYTAISNYNGYTYRLYYPADNEKVAFLITYVIQDVVVVHADVAELYWNFITPNDYDDINDVQVRVLLPSADNSSNFRLWAHGDLSGQINKLNTNDGVLATISHMDATSLLDIRLTFNKSLITDMSHVKTTSDNALEGIIEVEEARAEVANQLRDELNLKRNIVIGYSWILIALVIGCSILVYFKYAKSPKSSYYSKYNREFIDEYNVEVIDYLMKRQITPNALSASIMNLIYKKNISAKEVLNDNKKEKDYEFTLENVNNLNGSENILIQFLFDTVGEGKVNEKGAKTFTTIDLKKYAGGSKTCSSFIKSYTSWKNSVLQEGINQKFFETSKVPKLIGTGILLLAIILLFLIIQFETDYIPSYVAIMLAIIFFIIALVVYKKTIRGSEHYARWKAFRNFLDDFGAFELKELPEIILWERYLVYATIFGLADKVEKSMNVRISEMDMSSLSSDYYPTFFYIHIGPSIHTSFNNAINSAYHRQSANYANTHSSRSSGGGFGGGFSSGGGFGGGGSSGHGF